VETVLKNINHNVVKREGIGHILGVPEIAEREEQIHDMLQDKKIFEVRVVKCPGYPIEKRFDVATAEWVEESTWKYPSEEIKKWMETPEDHEIIERHYFGMGGLINLQ
jgi:hypothetical protein